jgi:hypothetical protein
LIGNADVKAWYVDGVENGSSSVGTVSGGANPTYYAPGEAPSKNPVAISAVVDTHNPKAGQVQVISNVVVKPESWFGFIRMEYMAEHSSKVEGGTVDTSVDMIAVFPIKSVVQDA